MTSVGAIQLFFGEEWLQRVAAIFVACHTAFTTKYPGRVHRVRRAKHLQIVAQFNPTGVYVSMKPFSFQPWHLRFMLKHCDAELCQMISDSVPPIDLNKITAFRSSIQKFEQKAFGNQMPPCFLMMLPLASILPLQVVDDRARENEK